MNFWLLFGLVLVAVWFFRLIAHPYGPCPACRKRRGRNAGSTAVAWGRCPRCGGTGERLRLAARLLLGRRDN